MPVTGPNFGIAIDPVTPDTVYAIASSHLLKLGGTASRAASRVESARWILKNGAERGASRRFATRSHWPSINPAVDRFSPGCWMYKDRRDHPLGSMRSAVFPG